MYATLGGATFGGAALGTGPSPVASGLSIRLAGAAIPATWTADQLRIAESVEQRAVADLTLVARTGPAQVAPGTRLDVAQDGVVLFTGTVERTVDAILSGSARAVEIKLTAVDASQIADRRLITDRVDFAIDAAHPTGWRADTIARTLVHSYLAGEGVTAFSTDCGSFVTTAFAFQSVAQALTQLAEATGSVWKIGPTRDLTFGPRTLNLAPRTVTDSSVLEQARVERTRERLRTVQVVRGYTSAVASDTMDSLAPWTVSTPSVPINGPKIEAWVSSGTDNGLRIPENTWGIRHLGLTVPTQITWNWREISRAAAGSIPWDPYHFHVLADAGGAGPALWFRPVSLGVPNPRLDWGLTTANCWTHVETPATINSLVGIQQSLAATLNVTGSGVSLVLQQGAQIFTHSFAALTTRGGYFGIVAQAHSASGVTLKVDNLTWPVSEATLYTVTRESGIASIQALEGGTGRYEAIVERPQTLVTSDAIVADADALLRRFSAPPFILTFDDDTPGYRAGQLLPVSLSAFGLGDDMLIESVTMRLDGGVGKVITRVQAVSDEQQGQVSDFWRQVAG